MNNSLFIHAKLVIRFKDKNYDDYSQIVRILESYGFEVINNNFEDGFRPIVIIEEK